jgi:hypothetical protein
MRWASGKRLKRYFGEGLKMSISTDDQPVSRQMFVCGLQLLSLFCWDFPGPIGPMVTSFPSKSEIGLNLSTDGELPASGSGFEFLRTWWTRQ